MESRAILYKSRPEQWNHKKMHANTIPSVNPLRESFNWICQMNRPLDQLNRPTEACKHFAQVCWYLVVLYLTTRIKITNYGGCYFIGTCFYPWRHGNSSSSRHCCRCSGDDWRNDETDVSTGTLGGSRRAARVYELLLIFDRREDWWTDCKVPRGKICAYYFVSHKWFHQSACTSSMPRLAPLCQMVSAVTVWMLDVLVNVYVGMCWVPRPWRGVRVNQAKCVESYVFSETCPAAMNILLCLSTQSPEKQQRFTSCCAMCFLSLR